MNLFNVILGNNNLLSDDFQIVYDENGNQYISKPDIHQKVRMDKSLEIDELKLLYSASNCTAYELPESIRLVNNMKTFNLYLIPKRSTKHVDEHYVFLTLITDNYRVLNYTSNTRIVQTYHGDNYQGCVICVPNDFEDNGTIMSLDLVDVKSSKNRTKEPELKSITLKYVGGRIQIRKKSMDKSRRESSKEKDVKYRGHRNLGFKIQTNKGELVTSTFIINEKYADIIDKKTKLVHKRQIILVPKDKFNDDETIKSLVEEYIRSNNIRAVTLYGVEPSLKLLKELKLLYVFNLDLKNNILSCRKSN